jgi:arylsulfatase A-like enzyme
MRKLSRRNFLKLAALTPAALAFSKLFSPRPSPRSKNPDLPNVIFLVFDTMSAYHLSLYNYQRKTTPNLERFAKRANLYHAHYSAANFTVPGTSSMLTGLHPWTHRAMHLSGLIARNLTDHNIFKLLGENYHRFAFSQNVWATNLLNQFRLEIDQFLPSSSFSDLSILASEFFPNDRNTAHQILDNTLFDFVDSPGSLLFGLAQRFYFERIKKKSFDRDFPRGTPQPRNYPLSYKLENLFNGLMDTIDGLSSPFFSYIHVFSPHSPYRAHKNFIGMFDDGWTYPRKPDSVFTEHETYEDIEQNRIWYDEYIANVDFEFGRLLDHLEKTGILEHSYLVVTSDHGELLERGVKGHVTPLLYEPLVRVPLIISSPGQTQGKNIHLPTSSVDLLPTLLHLAGREIPQWAEGKLLPGLGGNEDAERAVYMLEAKSSSAFGKLPSATFALRKGKYKIIMYHGYEVFKNKDVFELYDLENDPEERDDLFGKQPALAEELRKEIIKKFEEVDQLPPA